MNTTENTKEFKVIGSGKLSKLTKFESSIEEFILNSLSETIENEKKEKITRFIDIEKQKEMIGISISEKKLRQSLSDWNKDKMTVHATKIDLCAKSKKVCQDIASSFSVNNDFVIIPVVKANDKQGTFYITFVSKDNLKSEYTEKELKISNTKEKLYLDEIQKIISKEDFSSNVTKDNEKTNKINGIIKALELLK